MIEEMRLLRKMRMNNKVTVIDAGSNAIRLAIARQKGSHFELIYKLREPIRLGGDVFHQGKVSPSLIKETIIAFKKFKRISKDFGCQTIKAIGTSALREAKNQKALVQKILKETGIELDVISGNKESQLVFKAICAEMNLKKSKTLLIDIGGGSVELVAVDKGRIIKGKSFPIGTVRLLQQIKGSKKDYYDQIRSIEPKMKEALKFIKSLSMDFDYCVGIGGNIERMIKVNSLIAAKNQSKNLNLSDIIRMYDIVAPFSIGKRMKVFDLKSDQADVLIPALVLCTYFLQATKCQQLKIPGVGIKDGLILEELHL